MEEVGELDKFMNALEHTDTVICRLTGVGEEEFSTREIHTAIRELWYRANGSKVKKVDKSSAVWVGVCPKCGRAVVKRDSVENCGNMNCKTPLYWE